MSKSSVDLKKLLSQMTIDEKIGQLVELNAEFFIKSASEVTGPATSFGFSEQGLSTIGSTLNFNGAREMRAIQAKHLENDRNKIPMLFAMDVIHGYKTLYPIPLSLGCSFDPELVRECCSMAASEASAAGVQLTFAPMLDFCREPRWGRVMETCGEDAYLNSVMGVAQVKGYQGDDLSEEGNIAASVKHLAAYGGAEGGRDYNTVELSEHILREFYLPAYKACIDAGAKLVMPSFNNLGGVPATANPWIMKKILREEWGYDGLVVSDYAALRELMNHGVTGSLKESAEVAFRNECDVEMMSGAYYKHLHELIDEGVFSEDELDRSVMRMLELKAELGLFDDPYHKASEEKERELFYCEKHREIARRAAEESAVLLKNDGVLPLSDKIKKIAVIGPFRDTGAINGFWTCCGDKNYAVTVTEGIREILPEAEIVGADGVSAKLGESSTDGIDEAVRLAESAESVVLCVGEAQDYIGEARCIADITLSAPQRELVRRVCEANPNTAVLLFNGRPIVLTGIADVAPAMLEMFFPGTEGGRAAANLLFGRVNPSGKLSMSFPKHVGQIPVYYNRTMTGRPKRQGDDVFEGYTSSYMDCGILPLYFFGEGLSYTKFVYEEMSLDRREMGESDTLTVSVTVRNTGERAGKEVVQLYLRDLVSSTVRPVQELIAFEKIALEAGERRTVRFEISEPMLRLWNFENKFVSEKGDFLVSVGYADHMYFSEKFTLVK